MQQQSKQQDPEIGVENSRFSLPLEFLKSVFPYLVAISIAAIVAYWLVDPAPPKKIVISISKQDGNYRAFASLYGVLLQQEGIELEIRESDGTLKSLADLGREDAGVDMAFLPGGIATLQSTVGLVSLGSLYYEPIWIFCKGRHVIHRMSSLKGMRIAVGKPGSGTYILSRRLLDAAGVTESNSKFLGLGDDEAAVALRDGSVDAIILSGVPTSPLIEQVARMPGVVLAGLEESEAYARQFAFLHHLVLPESALSLADNIPPQPISMLAPTVSLAARESMNQALVYLVLKVVSRVHGEAGMLQQAHEFPSEKGTELEMSSQAVHFYRSGPPFLDRYLPFWAATFVNRVLIILLPLLALAIPLSRVAPAIYTWLIKSRIYKLYGELRFLELQVRKSQLPRDTSQLNRELDAIENKVNNLRLPVAYTSHLYELRSHIDFVRGRLGAKVK